MVKVSNIQSRNGVMLRGVQLEVDGHIVPELADLKIDCPVDGLVTITAKSFATEPFSVELTENVRVVIEHHDAIALGLLRDLLDGGSAAHLSARRYLEALS